MRIGRKFIFKKPNQFTKSSMKSQVQRSNNCESKPRSVTENSNSKSVFVGGIPSHLTAEDIQEIFSKYGRVMHVKMAFKKGQPLMNNGYCVLTMATSQQAISIMQTRKIPIGEDRFAICKPFMSGSNLESFRQRHNRLKVIIKGIPHQLTEERLRTFFESEVGALEEVFIFQSDKPLIRTPKHKLVQSARVTFTNQQQVKHFFEQGIFETEVMIDGFYVKLELFRPDYKLPKKKVQKSEAVAAEANACDVLGQASDRNTLSLKSGGERNLLQNYWLAADRRCNFGQSVPQENLLSHDDQNLRFNISKASVLAIHQRAEFSQSVIFRPSHEDKFTSKQTISSQ
jgi:RNA recognition motif-containing protein